jgi:hypothetical protein
MSGRAGRIEDVKRGAVETPMHMSAFHVFVYFHLSSQATGMIQDRTRMARIWRIITDFSSA